MIRLDEAHATHISREVEAPVHALNCLLAILREALALIHIHEINVAVAFDTELIKVLGPWSRAL